MPPARVCVALLCWAIVANGQATLNISIEEDPWFPREENCNILPSHYCVNQTTFAHSNRGCQCDDACAEFGDCCADAIFASERPKPSRYQCVQVTPNRSAYMVASCPGGGDSDVRSKCEGGSPAAISHHGDPLMHLPVTSLASNTTYVNYFCAICNNDVENLRTWGLKISCQGQDKEDEGKTSTERDGDDISEMSRVEFVDGNWRSVNGNTCRIELQHPENLWPRVCVASVSTCNDSASQELCDGHTSIVYHSITAYKNQHCAECHNISSLEVTCIPPPLAAESPVFRFGPGFDPFTVLIDFTDLSGGNGVGSRCAPGQLWDPFFYKCHNLRCRDQQHLVEGECVDASPRPPINTTCGNAADELHFPGNCSDALERPNITCARVILPDGDFELLTNGSVWVPRYGLVYDPDEFDLGKEGVSVCPVTSSNDKYPPLMGLVTLVGLLISSLCLVLHLVAFTLVPHLRNLHGKNLASLALSLLLAYATFMASVLGEANSTGCFVLSILVYYFFLASFSWMNMQGLDVFITFRQAATQLRVSSGHQWGRFLAYSAVGWVLPLLPVVAVVVIDLAPPEALPQDFLPQLGRDLCWFGQRKALLVFFGAPLFTSIAVNLVLFTVTTAILVSSKQSSVRSSASGETKRQFQLFTRLSVLMGLSWVTATLGAYWETQVAWYAFVVLNTLQGLFIFLAFTCRTRVWQDIRKALPCATRTRGSKKDKSLEQPASTTSLSTSNTLGSSHASIDTTKTYVSHL